MAGVDLRHVLLDLLPSSDMTERCRELSIHHHLEKIIPDLWAFNAVIWDAMIRAGTQPDVEMWMADAGAAIADIQNLLDRILEWPGRAAAPSNPLLRSCLSIRVAFRLSILQELKEMGLRLKELVRRGTALDLRKEMMDAMDPCDEKYSYVLGDEVVGRYEDRDNIVEILQQNQSSSNGEPFTIQIRDKGSFRSLPCMGKTILARMIYHHPWVRQHFHHRIWVDVSIDLSWDQLSIGREFARSITGESCDHLQSHQAIWLLVNERLGQRRYLLILNDVYCDDTEEGLKDKWDQLKHNLLHVGGIGSTVIITTKRYSWPIDIFGSREYLLDGLSEDAWIKLVMRDTFIGSAQDKENTCTINFLLQFAEQQYKTHNGSPMLAKTLGSIFRYTEVSRWQEVFYICFVFRYTEVSRWQVADALSSYSDIIHHQYFKLMSFQHLSTKLARLRLYSSLCNLDQFDDLTEDYMHMMIAEDLMPQQLFDGENIQKLVDEVGYLFVTKDYYYLRTRIGQDSIGILQQCCHLCLVDFDFDFDSDFDFDFDFDDAFPTALSAGVTKRLRTLILHKKKDKVEKGQKYQITEIPAAMFTNMVHLRILHLSHCRIQQLPNTIAKLVSLRYLNLSYTEIQSLPKYLSNLQNLKILKLTHCENFRKLPEWIHKLKKLLILKLAYCQKLQMLPESITALTNLQELDVEGCQSFMKLPEGLASIKNLIMLNVDKCVSLTRLPHGIGQLTNLQKLLVHATADSLASVILELRSLVNLKELRMKKLNGLSSVEDARALKLNDKIFLKCLALCWEWRDMEVALVTNTALLHEQVLENLQPNLALEKLEIVSYMGKKLPSWMACKEGNLWHLREIKLVNLRKCERLPPLGQLPWLETVEISGMDSIITVDDAFFGDYDDTFYSLKSLIFSEMPVLERWLKAKDGHDMFPWLERLILIQCPKFKELHVRPSSTRKLLILELWLNNDKLLTSEFVGWQNLLYVEVLEITGCEELRCLPQGLKHLKFLHELEIIRCNNLISLPDWLAELPSLNRWEEHRIPFDLIVRDCAMLSSIPERLKPSPDFRMKIKGCPKLGL